jgi:hypothetical protein
MGIRAHTFDLRMAGAVAAAVGGVALAVTLVTVSGAATPAGMVADGASVSSADSGSGAAGGQVNPDWTSANALFTQASSLSATSGDDKGVAISKQTTTGDDGIVLLRVFIPAYGAAGNLLLGDNRGFTSDPAEKASRADVAWNTATGQVAFIVNHSSVGPLLVSGAGSEGGAPPPVQIGDPISALSITDKGGAINHQTADDQPRSDNQIGVTSASSGLTIDLSLLNPLTNQWSVAGVNLGAWTVDQIATITQSAAGSYQLKLTGNGYPALEAYYYPHYASTASATTIARRSVEPYFVNRPLDTGGGEAALDSNSWVNCADTAPSSGVFECTNTVPQYKYVQYSKIPERPWDTSDTQSNAM